MITKRFLSTNLLKKFIFWKVNELSFYISDKKTDKLDLKWPRVTTSDYKWLREIASQTKIKMPQL